MTIRSMDLNVLDAKDSIIQLDDPRFTELGGFSTLEHICFENYNRFGLNIKNIDSRPRNRKCMLSTMVWSPHESIEATFRFILEIDFSKGPESPCMLYTLNL